MSDCMNQSKQDVNYTVHVPQTSEEVEDDTHDDTHDGRPRTPIRIKARTYEDGNPSNIQTKKNPDHQILETVMPMESEQERTLFSHSDDNDTSRQRIKLSTKVSAVKEESPEENVLKEDLVERNKIFEQHCQKDGNPSSIQTQKNPDHQILETVMSMKSEHERTLSSPSDDNETKRLGGVKLSTKVSKVVEKLPEENVFKEDLVESPKENLKLVESYKILKQNYEELFRSSILKDEEFKIERKQTEEKYEELLRLKDEKIRGLRTERKQYKEIFASTILKQENDLQAKHDEDIRKVQELWNKVCVSHSKNIRELKDKIAISEKDYGDVLEVGRLAVQSHMEETRKQKDENARLIKGMEDEIARLEHEKSILVHDVKECKKIQICQVCLDGIKQILLLPCGHFCICQKCFVVYNRECPICRMKITGYVKVFNS